MKKTASVGVTRERGTSIELFTGGGGLALGMHAAGFRHALAVEWERRACETLRANRAADLSSAVTCSPGAGAKWPLIEGDIRGVDFTCWSGVDVVAGGVPCQPWSLGGVHRGVEDDRNLWPELFRCIREVRPRAVIAENVKGLLRPSFKPYYDYILRELSAPFEERVNGEDWRDHDKRLMKALRSETTDPTEYYDVKFKLVNAADYGVPQVRWRVVVVAFRRDLDLADWAFPSPTHSGAALLHDQASGEYWERHGLPKAQYDEPDLVRPPRRKAWRTIRDAIADMPEPAGERMETPGWIHHVGWPGARQYPGHTPNALDRPAKTVKAGVHGVPGGESVLQGDDDQIRYMTVREVARVMTFPDKWKLVGPRGEQMRQLGNAVPVRLGKVIAGSVARAMSTR